MTPQYLAGFIDGEGCIDVQRYYQRGKYAGQLYVRPRLRIVQATSGKLMVNMLTDKFGGHVYHRKRGNKNQQDSVSWEFVSYPDVKRILKIILPHLIVKREQAKLVLWWIKHMQGIRSDNFAGIIEARTVFAEELSAMKRDSQRLSERAIAKIKRLMR